MSYTDPAFIIPTAASVPDVSATVADPQLVYFPIARNLSYSAARDASNALPASGFGKSVRYPRMPLLVTGEFIDGRGYLRPRTSDGALLSFVDLHRNCFAVYFPAPFCIDIFGLFAYFDNALKPFAGYKDIILKYQTLSDKSQFLEFSTGNQLVQCDLGLLFLHDGLKYCGCRIGRGSNWWT